MAESRLVHISTAGKLSRVSTLGELLEALEGGGYAWLDFLDPSKEDLTALVEPLGVHPLSIEDCLDEDQVPKIEDFPANTFMIFNSYRVQGQTLAIEELGIIIGKNFLVTVTGHQGGSLRLRDKVEETAALDQASVKRGPDFLLHIILDVTVDHKLAAIESLQDEIDAGEEAILKGSARFTPKVLMRLRRHLLALRKSLFHEREILVKICRGDCPYISQKSVYHFRDIYDHLVKYFETVEIGREMITSLMEMHLSMVNNRMAEVGNRTNATVRRLTLITTVFMPLTLLAGIGGMSEWSMMTGPSNWRIAYPAFLAALVILGAINYYILKVVEERGRKM